MFHENTLSNIFSYILESYIFFRATTDELAQCTQTWQSSCATEDQHDSHHEEGLLQNANYLVSNRSKTRTAVFSKHKTFKMQNLFDIQLKNKLSILIIIAVKLPAK